VRGDRRAPPLSLLARDVVTNGYFTRPAQQTARDNVNDPRLKSGGLSLALPTGCWHPGRTAG